MNFQPLKDFLDYHLPMLGVPGSDTVIYRNHEEIFRYSSGYDNIELKTPVRRDAVYSIYSCTKIIVSVAAVQLIERGEMLPTDPLYAYIPEYRFTEEKVYDENGAAVGTKKLEKPILIGHLLTMTSGMNYALNKPEIEGIKKLTDGRAPTLDVCRALAASPLDFTPGSNYKYGLSYDVLGGVIELVSGMKLSEYVKENILEPLGMKDTAFTLDENLRSRLATKYEYNTETGEGKIIPAESNVFKFGTEYESGGAGLYSTVDDYILFADALAMGGVGKNGERIISKYGIDLMRANALNDVQMKGFDFSHCKGYGYGYGVRCCINPHPYGNIAPVGEFGWDGAKLCYASVSPETRISMFHAEHMGGLHSLVVPRLRNLLYSCIGE